MSNFVNIMHVSTAPTTILEMSDKPYSWCDKDYPFDDLAGTDDDITFEEILI